MNVHSLESSAQSLSPTMSTGGQSSCDQQQDEGGGGTDRSVAGEMTDEQSLTDRLMSMAVQGGDESDENDEDYLSASDGESDDQKIQQWGDTLPEPVDIADSAPLQTDTSSPGKMCSASDAEGDGDKNCSKDRPLDPAEPEAAAAVAEGDLEEGGDKNAGGDGRSSDCDEKDDKAGEKEEDKEKKRQEEEDALTEEERQVGDFEVQV